MFDKVLFNYDIREETFKETVSIPAGSKDLLTTIALDNSDNLWIGTARSGVSLINARDGQIQTLPYLEMIKGKKI